MNDVEKPTILHLIDSLAARGGTENYLVTSLPHMQDFRHRVCCLYSAGALGERLSEHVPVYVLEGKTAPIRAVRRFWAIVHREKPDILVTYLPTADLFGRVFGRLLGIPTIVCSLRSRLTPLRFLPWLIAERSTSCLVTKYHAVSPAIQDFYVQYLGAPQSKITVIPNCVEVERFVVQRDALEIRRRFGLRPTAFVLVCVARLHVPKGHWYLLRAFQILRERIPDATLLLAGTGPDRARVVRWVKDLGLRDSVLLLGDREDVPDILHAADIFVLATLYEGMSNALLEAMASGRAIITTDIPENRVLITHGVHGILVPPRDVPALADAMADLAGDRAKRRLLGRAAARRVRDHFDIRWGAAELQRAWHALCRA